MKHRVLVACIIGMFGMVGSAVAGMVGSAFTGLYGERMIGNVGGPIRVPEVTLRAPLPTGGAAMYARNNGWGTDIDFAISVNPEHVGRRGAVFIAAKDKAGSMAYFDGTGFTMNRIAIYEGVLPKVWRWRYSLPGIGISTDYSFLKGISSIEEGLRYDNLCHKIAPLAGKTTGGSSNQYTHPTESYVLWIGYGALTENQEKAVDHQVTADADESTDRAIEMAKKINRQDVVDNLVAGRELRRKKYAEAKQKEIDAKYSFAATLAYKNGMDNKQYWNVLKKTCPEPMVSSGN